MKREIKVVIVLLVILSLIMLAIFLTDRSIDPYFTKKEIEDVEFNNSKILKLNSDKKIRLYGYIMKVLNSRKFNYYDNVTFKTTDTIDNVLYIYFYIDDDNKSLFECSYKKDKFSITFLGDSLSPEYKSKRTGKVYLQIMNPKSYKEMIENEGKRQEMENSGIPD